MGSESKADLGSSHLLELCGLAEATPPLSRIPSVEHRYGNTYLSIILRIKLDDTCRVHNSWCSRNGMYAIMTTTTITCVELMNSWAASSAALQSCLSHLSWEKTDTAVFGSSPDLGFNCLAAVSVYRISVGLRSLDSATHSSIVAARVLHQVLCQAGNEHLINQHK